MEGVTTKNKVIEILYSHEYRLLVDDNIFDSSKFFYPVYQRSVELLKEIHSYPKSGYGKSGSKFYNENKIVYPNNLIMYCANRGGGKSSAMLSFGNALKDINDTTEESDSVKKDFWGELSRCRFSVLDAIDPTSLCEKEVIMKIILSRLFLEIRKELKKNQNEQRNGNIHLRECETELIRKSRECYKFINVISGESKIYDEEENDDSLEELASLGDSSSLKERFHELVELYLKYKFGTEKIQNKYLVLQIDDADLNTSKSYEMIEDLRRYCIVPNVVILMAVNMSQMHQVIEKHFVDEFNSLLRVGVDSPFVSIDNIKDMAVKYINKVMPAAHQIYLPEIDDYLQNSPSALDLKYIKVNNDCDEIEPLDLLRFTGSEKEKTDKVTDYQERLIRLIYLKTGIAMVKPDTYSHNFLPQSMRELTHFLTFMLALPDLNDELNYAELFALLSPQCKISKHGKYTKEDAEKELVKRKNNLEAFERYFINNWCDMNLSKSDNMLISEISGSVSSIKVSFASNACISFVNSKGNDMFVPELTKNSFSGLMRMIDKISDEAKEGRNPLGAYKRAYALHLYFTIFLHREMMISIENHSFKRFRSVVGFELWTPDYNRFTEYPLSGRFTVNYSAYLKLSKKLDYIREWAGIDWDSEIEQSCFMRFPDKTYPIDYSEPKISNAVRCLTNDVECDAEIIFDLGFVMLNKITTETNYNCTSNKQFRALNDLIFILLNWDVNHHAEKELHRMLNNITIFLYPIFNWHGAFFQQMHDIIEKLHDYLPHKFSEAEEFIKADNTIDNDIFFANLKIQTDYVKQSLKKINANSPALIPEDSEMTKKSGFILGLCSNSIPKLEQICSSLDKSVIFSRSLRKIVDKLNKLSKSFEELNGLISTESGSSLRPWKTFVNDSSDLMKSEKITSYISENLGILMRAYTEWKTMISDAGLEAMVVAEITESFKLRKNGEQ